SLLLLLMLRRLPCPLLFPYTTLFRSIKAYKSALYKVKAVLGHGQKELVDDLSERIAVVKNQYLPENRNEQLNISQLLRAINQKRDRKSTRLNSSHVKISYAVFCLKKK